MPTGLPFSEGEPVVSADTLQLWFGWSRIRKQMDELVAILGLQLLIAEQSVGNRPRSIEPRAIKRRPNPYPLLTKPRGRREKIWASKKLK